MVVAHNQPAGTNLVHHRAPLRGLVASRKCIEEIRGYQQGRPLALHGVCNADAILCHTVADLALHHSPSRTAQIRTGSPTPFTFRLPRSSNCTPAEVRASERTVSDTSTSPGAERPLMREAILTAPPYTLLSSRITSPAWRP